MGITEAQQKRRDARRAKAPREDLPDGAESEPSEDIPGKLSGSGRLPRTDPPIKRLETPVIQRAVVRVYAGKLTVRCDSIDDAEQYEWELRRGPGHGLSKGRTSNKARTEFTEYPVGVPGTPQVRVRALGDGAISLWSEWAKCEHDMGNLDG